MFLRCLHFWRPSSPAYEGHPFISEQICWFYRQCHWMWVSRFPPRSVQLEAAGAPSQPVLPASRRAVAPPSRRGWEKHPRARTLRLLAVRAAVQGQQSLINTCFLICCLCSFTRALKSLFFNIFAQFYSCFFEGEDLLPERLLSDSYKIDSQRAES